MNFALAFVAAVVCLFFMSAPWAATAQADEAEYTVTLGLGDAHADTYPEDSSWEGVSTLLLDGASPSSHAQFVYDEIVAAAETCQKTVTFSRSDLITLDEAYDAFDTIVYDPELWWMEPNMDFTYLNINVSGKGYQKIVTKITLYYILSSSELPAARSAVEGKVSEALSWVNTSTMSTAQQVQAIHDYLVRNCIYESGGSEAARVARSAYGTLVKGRAVCQGYSLTFKLLLTRLGIPCVYIESESMNHSWNMVKVSGRWYHVDVTWDDPLYSNNTDGGFNASITYSNFLKSDTSIKSTGHYSWKSLYTSSGDYSYTPSTYKGPASQGSSQQTPQGQGSGTQHSTSLFPDTPSDAWYVTGGYLDYVVANGLMSGYADGSGRFGPEDTVTRAQVATILYRYATGKQGGGGQVSYFADVAVGMWYTEPIEWCRRYGIVTGYKDGSGRFGPNDPVTREQLATMMWRFAGIYGANGSSGSIWSFPDAGSVSDYAVTAMGWCASKGIITGDKTWNPARLNPQGNATRAQMAKIVTVTTRDVIGGASIVVSPAELEEPDDDATSGDPANPEEVKEADSAKDEPAKTEDPLQEGAGDQVGEPDTAGPENQDLAKDEAQTDSIEPVEQAPDEAPDETAEEDVVPPAPASPEDETPEAPPVTEDAPIPDGESDDPAPEELPAEEPDTPSEEAEFSPEDQDLALIA